MGLADAWHRLTRAPEQVEADELREDALRSGVQPITDGIVGQPTTIAGTVRSITLQPLQSVPALQAEVYDGTGSVTVIWLGRRRIIGIEPGRRIVVSGRLTSGVTGLTIFNPRYELKPSVG